MHHHFLLIRGVINGHFGIKDIQQYFLLSIMMLVNLIPYYQPNPNYHHLSDTLGTLNPRLMKSITQLALATVATISERYKFCRI